MQWTKIDAKSPETERRVKLVPKARKAKRQPRVYSYLRKLERYQFHRESITTNSLSYFASILLRLSCRGLTTLFERTSAINKPVSAERREKGQAQKWSKVEWHSVDFRDLAGCFPARRVERQKSSVNRKRVIKGRPGDLFVPARVHSAPSSTRLRGRQQMYSACAWLHPETRGGKRKDS